MDRIRSRDGMLAAILLATIVGGGCRTVQSRKEPIEAAPVPRELEKVSLPDYRVEPPDILLIDAVKAVPKPPHRVDALDVLFLQLSPSLPDEPLSGLFTVAPEGIVQLGPSYGGGVQVMGLTIPEVQAVLVKHFQDVVKIKDPKVTVTLAQSQAAERISGAHLIRPDGTISLGTYGRVHVAGMTIPQVRQAVEAHLAQYLLNPEVGVDVQNYNSKLFYVILDGGGLGQTVVRLPVTGNDTVIDAISQVNGLTPVSSRDRMWVSRPAPAGECHQILPVDWRAISECGDTATNYQLMPGDRVFVASYPLIHADSAIARVLSPIERLFGASLLGASTVNQIRFPPNRFNFNNGSTGAVIIPTTP